MLIKILGAFDVIIGLVLLFSAGIDLPSRVLFVFGLIMISKSSLGMLKDFASWVDFLGGVVLFLLMIISVPGFISFIIGMLIIQKGIFSMI